MVIWGRRPASRRAGRRQLFTIWGERMADGFIECEPCAELLRRTRSPEERVTLCWRCQQNLATIERLEREREREDERSARLRAALTQARLGE